MKQVIIKIEDPKFLHTNISKQIAEKASKFVADVWVVVGSNKANAKSLISLMSALGSAKLPTKVEIIAENWTDEQEAVAAIKEIFEK